MKRMNTPGSFVTTEFKSSLKHECGVFGIFHHPEAANLTYLGLYALQHRGQEGAGIVSSDGKKLYQERKHGLVSDVFHVGRLKRLKGHHAIGHVRYSTAGDDRLKNIQPLLIQYEQGPLSIAHNGNLTNAVYLKKQLEKQGSIFQTTSDTEIVLHLIAKSRLQTLEERIIEALKQVEGAYCFLFLTQDKLIAVRDPYGFRPLVLGAFDGNDACHVFASETSAFDLIDAKLIREVEPGEMISVSSDGMKSQKPFEPKPTKQCVFEHIYFARPDSFLFNENVYQVRTLMGKKLSQEQPATADIVVPVPDSGVPAAVGYAESSGIPFQMGIIRNHYVGRTFIEPEQAIRNFGVKIKLNPIRSILEGKSIVLVDDSIVRGTTSKKIVQLLRQNGAKEVHVRISAPPTIGPCYYGIDTPTKSELIASKNNIESIRKFIGADTLGYLSIEGMLSVFKDQKKYCTACFDDRYPFYPKD